MDCVHEIVYAADDDDDNNNSKGKYIFFPSAPEPRSTAFLNCLKTILSSTHWKLGLKNRAAVGTMYTHCMIL